MKYQKSKAVLLLFLILPYLFPGANDVQQDQPSHKNTRASERSLPQLMAEQNNPDNLFTHPEKISEPIFPDTYLRLAEKMIQQKNNCYREINYILDNDLYIHHPILSYKISLSTHTSDG